MMTTRIKSPDGGKWRAWKIFTNQINPKTASLLGAGVPQARILTALPPTSGAWWRSERVFSSPLRLLRATQKIRGPIKFANTKFIENFIL